MDYERLSRGYWESQVARIVAALTKITGPPAAPGRVVPEQGDLAIGEGRQLNLAVLFLDLSGFSARPAETALEQSILLRIFNLFFTEMIKILEEYGGTEDPLGFVAGNNFYMYVENDPVNRTDPSGLQSCCSGLECYSRCVNQFLVGPAVTTVAATAAAAANGWANFTRTPGGATEAERLVLRQAMATARKSGGTITPATVFAAMAAASRGGAAISGATGTAARIARCDSRCGGSRCGIGVHNGLYHRSMQLLSGG